MDSTVYLIFTIILSIIAIVISIVALIKSSRNNKTFATSDIIKKIFESHKERRRYYDKQVNEGISLNEKFLSIKSIIKNADIGKKEKEVIKEELLIIREHIKKLGNSFAFEDDSFIEILNLGCLYYLKNIIHKDIFKIILYDTIKLVNSDETYKTCGYKYVRIVWNEWSGDNN